MHNELLTKKLKHFMGTYDIEEIHMEFSGEGDSGGFEEFDITWGENATERDIRKIVMVNKRIANYTYGPTEGFARDVVELQSRALCTAEDYLYSLAEDLLSHFNLSGYENNEGGSGHFTITREDVTMSFGSTYEESNFEFTATFDVSSDKDYQSQQSLAFGSQLSSLMVANGCKSLSISMEMDNNHGSYECDDIYSIVTEPPAAANKIQDQLEEILRENDYNWIGYDSSKSDISTSTMDLLIKQEDAEKNLQINVDIHARHEESHEENDTLTLQDDDDDTDLQIALPSLDVLIKRSIDTVTWAAPDDDYKVFAGIHGGKWYQIQEDGKYRLADEAIERLLEDPTGIPYDPPIEDIVMNANGVSNNSLIDLATPDYRDKRDGRGNDILMALLFNGHIASALKIINRGEITVADHRNQAGQNLWFSLCTGGQNAPAHMLMAMMKTLREHGIPLDAEDANGKRAVDLLGSYTAASFQERFHESLKTVDAEIAAQENSSMVISHPAGPRL